MADILPWLMKTGRIADSLNFNNRCRGINLLRGIRAVTSGYRKQKAQRQENIWQRDHEFNRQANIHSRQGWKPSPLPVALDSEFHWHHCLVR